MALEVGLKVSLFIRGKVCSSEVGHEQFDHLIEGKLEIVPLLGEEGKLAHVVEIMPSLACFHKVVLRQRLSYLETLLTLLFLNKLREQVLLCFH